MHEIMRQFIRENVFGFALTIAWYFGVFKVIPNFILSVFVTNCIAFVIGKYWVFKKEDVIST